ncbi:MAG TPA: site-2 protease family protein [Candidatus Saccharimonadales bacterium]|nr:site-2 protease family protein [Candidatus Saccharimonadales bacterium]
MFTTHYIVWIVLSILVSMTCHEAMHAYVAHTLGDTTAKDEGRLTLNPLKHIDLIATVMLPVILLLLGLPPIFVAKPVPFDPRNVRYGDYGAALVGIAGPFTNLALAYIGSLLIRFFASDDMLISVFTIFTQVNIAFFVFNMIPLPPLDGSRLLYAFAPEPLQELMQQLERTGSLVIILVLVLLLPGFSNLLINLNNDIFTFLLR